MEHSFNKSKKVYYFNAKEKHSAYEFSKSFATLLSKNELDKKQLIFLCIGTDRATGDSLGPIVGYKLSKINGGEFMIYGTLDQPVHAKNLDITLTDIQKNYPNALIVAIDSSLGVSNHIGYITLGEGSLNPGSGVAKKLPAVGDIHITGIVNLSGFLDHMLLQTTRLNTVMDLADCICLGIRYSIYQTRVAAAIE